MVFVSAYDQYAIEAFEREAVDYLLKPVSKERLVDTVRRIRRNLGSSAQPSAELAEAVERALAVDTDPTEGYRPSYIGGGD